ncbi:MAG: acyl-CoA thioesterase [Planctomycetaceae bacterium]|jgi:acyl-CoA thioester hydrolase|nr:acyl-CoA thioesterase [Planctomycetaceae bacterium]
MTDTPESKPLTHEIQFRVRYAETDQGGILYHGNYFTYFEVGRTELSRSLGKAYREIEEEGLFGVVAKAECSYKKPAKYDDLLTIRTTIQKITRVKIEYEHLVLRDSEILAVGHITLAFVDRNGTIQRVPDWMRPEN